LSNKTRKLKDIKKPKAASHFEMPNFGSDVDGFTVNKSTQEICSSQNKNETNTTTTFTIKHDKYEGYFFHSEHEVHKFIGEHTMC
jgi:hypothetical protein